MATRSFTKDQKDFNAEDECDLLLKGYLAFQDPPKLDALPVLKGLKDLGITVKVTSEVTPPRLDKPTQLQIANFLIGLSLFCS